MAPQEALVSPACFHAGSLERRRGGGGEGWDSDLQPQ